MRGQVERWLIAANMSMDAIELKEFKEKLFKDLLENHPDVLTAMENDL